MKQIIVLIKKEIKELLTMTLLIPIVIMVFFFSFIGRLMKGEMQKAQKPTPIYLIDNDQTETSQNFIYYLKKHNFIVNESNKDLKTILSQAKIEKINNIVVIPLGLEAELKSFNRPTIQLYSLINNLSPFDDIGIATLRNALNLFNDSISSLLIRRANPNIPIISIKQPLQLTNYVQIKEQLIQADPVQLKNAIRVQTIFIPIILLMVIIYISQMIGAAMGQEKENKTLETLLTFPVSRFKILLGKMFGAGFVAILLSVVFIIGIRFYLTPMNMYSPSSAPNLLNLVNTAPNQTTLYGILALSLFLAIICAASLATLLTIFASDAKQAQVIITPINILALFPYLIVLMSDIKSLSPILQIILYLNPFTYPFIMTQAVFFNQLLIIIGGMLYMVLFAIVITLIAAKIFSSDRILTAKLKLKK
ncbi:MAG: ABC transporter permease [candidate division WOR-3 bacterium]